MKIHNYYKPNTLLCACVCAKHEIMKHVYACRLPVCSMFHSHSHLVPRRSSFMEILQTTDKSTVKEMSRTIATQCTYVHTYLVKRAVLQCVKEAFLVHQLQEPSRGGRLVWKEHGNNKVHYPDPDRLHTHKTHNVYISIAILSTGVAITQELSCVLLNTDNGVSYHSLHTYIYTYVLT